MSDESSTPDPGPKDNVIPFPGVSLEAARAAVAACQEVRPIPEALLAVLRQLDVEAAERRDRIQALLSGYVLGAFGADARVGANLTTGLITVVTPQPAPAPEVEG